MMPPENNVEKKIYFRKNLLPTRVLSSTPYASMTVRTTARKVVTTTLSTETTSELKIRAS